VANPFVVPVAALLRQVGASSRVRFVAPFDPDGALAAPTPGAAEIVPGADVDVDVTLTSYLGAGLRATGTLTTTWRATCRRCAKDAGGVLEVAVAERFSADAGPEDDEAYPIVAEHVDLRELVSDAVLLELPLAPMCKEDCEGLCPTCGADRNDGPCGCRPEVDPRWATLDALRGADPA
jgi:uncharacterized protein